MRAIGSGESLFITGLVLQELLQGFHGPRDQLAIVERLSSLPSITPALADHIAAAALRNSCTRAGIQVGTIDALLAQLCITHSLVLLTTDDDFSRISNHSDLQVWEPGSTGRQL